MRLPLWTLAFIPAVTGGLFALTCLAADAKRSSLITNGSFEAPAPPAAETPQSPKDWTYFSHEPKNVSLFVDATAVRTGKQALRLVSTGISDSYGGIFQSVPARPGQRFQFTAYARNDARQPFQGSAQVRLSLEWKDAVGNEITRTEGPAWGALPDGEWHQVQVSGQAPANAAGVAAVITLHEGSKPGGGAGYVDDAALVEAPPQR